MLWDNCWWREELERRPSEPQTWNQMVKNKDHSFKTTKAIRTTWALSKPKKKCQKSLWMAESGKTPQWERRRKTDTVQQGPHSHSCWCSVTSTHAKTLLPLWLHWEIPGPRTSKQILLSFYLRKSPKSQLWGLTETKLLNYTLEGKGERKMRRI